MMATTDQTLTFSQRVKAPPGEVYSAFTHATGLREWLCDGAVINAAAGGSYHIWWQNGYYASGEIVQMSPDQALSLTWMGRQEPSATTIEITFTPQGDDTLVTLVHGGLGTDEAWDRIRAESVRGWQSGLENLQSVMETGIDLRVSRRPMIGILIDDQIDARKASELGLPVEGGVIIGTPLEGMGAQAAGLQKGDIIVRMGDKAITTYHSFAPAVEPYQAGDAVEVAFYRDGELHSVTMILSQRPLPDPSVSASELAQNAEEQLTEVLHHVRNLLEGVSEEEAGYNPVADEWNVKQILAHLILSDRGTLFWLGTVLSGEETVHFPDNLSATTDAVIAVYPTVTSLVDELEQTWKELVALIARLPESFTSRKRSYARVVNGIRQISLHPETHYDQIENAIKAARSG
jgi:uncharacterized protein YndB with AHSA1/START domain